MHLEFRMIVHERSEANRVCHITILCDCDFFSSKVHPPFSECLVSDMDGTGRVAGHAFCLQQSIITLWSFCSGGVHLTCVVVHMLSLIYL